MTEPKKISWVEFAPTDRERTVPNILPIHWLAFTNQSKPHGLIDCLLAHWPEPASVKEYLEIAADMALALWDPPYPAGWFVMVRLRPMSAKAFWEGRLDYYRSVLASLRRMKTEAKRPKTGWGIEVDYEPEEEMLHDFDARSYAEGNRVPRHLLPADDQRELGKWDGRI